MNVPRDPGYKLFGFWAHLGMWVGGAMLALFVGCSTPVEAQNFCSTSDGDERTLVTTPHASARILLMNEACPGTPASDYPAMEISALLLLSGRVTTHATSCPGTTAISPAICYERDDDTVYICDQASGTACDEAGEWTEIVGGGGGLESVAPSDMDDDDFGDFICTTGVCALDADVVAPAEMADADHGDVTWSGGVATVEDDSHAHTTTTISGIVAADMGDADHGDVTWSSSVASVEDDSHAHGASTISGLDTADTTTGTFADARISATSVTQHESAIEAALEVGQLQGGLAADQVDTITDITASLKSGSDATLITGTAGAADDCAKFNADGDLVSAGGACGVASGDITDVFNCSSGDCGDIVAGATDSLDFSGVDSSGAGEGLFLPQHATACAGGTGDGQVCWEADDDVLYVGNGATLTEIGSGGGGSPEYHPDNYPPSGDVLLEDEFTSSLSLTWTDRNLDSAATSVTLGALQSSFYINNNGSTDAWHGSTTPAPADSGQDWYFVAKITSLFTHVATTGCGISVITGGTAATPTEINSVYLRSTSSTALAFEHLDHDDYDFAGSTNISTEAAGASAPDSVLARTRSFYLGFQWIDASEDLLALWSWDGFIWAAVALGSTDTTVDGYPVELGIFSRDNNYCTFQFVRVLDTDVDAAGNIQLKVGGP